MRMNFERRKIGLERKIKLLSESLAKEKKTRAGMKESELNKNEEKIDLKIFLFLFKSCFLLWSLNLQFCGSFSSFFGCERV